MALIHPGYDMAGHGGALRWQAADVIDPGSRTSAPFVIARVGRWEKKQARKDAHKVESARLLFSLDGPINEYFLSQGAPTHVALVMTDHKRRVYRVITIDVRAGTAQLLVPPVVEEGA